RECVNTQRLQRRLVRSLAGDHKRRDLIEQPQVWVLAARLASELVEDLGELRAKAADVDRAISLDHPAPAKLVHERENLLRLAEGKGRDQHRAAAGEDLPDRFC